MENKKVLVLLSSYNGEKYIADQIESILNQKTSHKVDLLIRDDGSTDSTVRILHEYVELNPNRIQLILGKNIGYIRSFFTLIKQANNYDYYALSDQDDVWMDNKIEKAIKALENENNSIPLLFASTSYLVHDDLIPFGITQKQIKEITFSNTIIQNIFPGHNQVMNQLLLDELKEDIDYSKIYVHDSWITNVAIIKGKVLFDNEPSTFYRQHNKNEVGYGHGKIGWIKERLRRIKSKHNVQYTKQIDYFFKHFNNVMNSIDYKHLCDFFGYQKNIFTRLFYVIFSCPLYRQKKIETLYFKLLYLMNGYHH